MAEPTFVVVFLRGGADGLALVSPASDPDFIAADRKICEFCAKATRRGM